MKKIYALLGFLFIVNFGFGQIISQYVETNSGTTPKGIEIWNNTGSTLDFATNNLVIEKGTNGAAPSTDFALEAGTLAAGEVIVIGTSDMETVTLGNGSLFFDKGFTFNGDDALVVKYGGTITDMFGVAGSDPGSAWSGGGVSTANQNIELNNGITSGAITGFADPSTRFNTVNTNPSGTNGDEGFGIAPSSVGGSGPIISNIIQSPTTVTTADTVSVSADITDADGTPNVTLNWGTSSGALNTSIAMNPSMGNTYLTFTSIPAQTLGTTVFYEVVATDTSGTTRSSEQSYTVISPPPSNDDCATAEPIVCGMNYTGDTTLATDSDSSGSADVFYSLAGTTLGQQITVSLCGSSFDTYLEVFDACGGNQVALNDDFCDFQSELTFTSDGTTNYIVRVEGFGAEDFGAFNLGVTCVAPTPTILLSETVLSDNLIYEVGNGPSANETFTVEGSNLENNIELNVAAEFQISTTTDDLDFGSTIMLPETSGTVSQTTIYVRLAEGLGAMTYTGTLAATSLNATTQNITLNGEVTAGSCAGSSTSFPYNGVSGITNLEHSSSNPPGSSGEDCGNNYRIYYTTPPATDSSGNYLRSNAGDDLIESADWGGEGKFETFSIDVSNESSVTIETFGNTIGNGFNAGSENLQWWYTLNGGPQINLGSAFTGTGSLAITPTDIDVSNNTALVVGFTFDMNGGSDGFENVDVTVTGAGCSLTSLGLSNITCNDNGTSADALDDFISFELDPTGSTLGGTYSVSISSGSVTPTSASYGSATIFTLQDGSAGSGDVTVTITDITDSGCTLNTTVTDSGSCSFPPSLLFEDFDDGNFTVNPTWTGNDAPGEFIVISAPIVPDGNASTDGSFLASSANQGDLSLAVESTEVTEWQFSIASPNFSPSSANNFGVVLMANAPFSGSISTSDFQGYYIKIGTNGGTDPIELWRKTGLGNDKVGDFPSSPNFDSAGLTNGLNIRVTRSASGVFELFYVSGFQYINAPTTSAGTLTNNVYDTSTHFGVFQEFSNTSSDRRVYFDNLNLVSLNPEPVTYIYNNGWLPSDPSGMSTSSDDIVVVAGDTNITGDTDINTIIVNPVGALTVNSGVTLTASSISLESNSSQYSSLVINDNLTIINGTVTYERFVNSNENGNDLIAPPLSGQDWSNFLTENAATLYDDGNTGPTTYTFGPFDKLSSSFVNYTDATTATLTSGRGYRAATDSGANLIFTGDVVTGDVDVTIENSGLSFAKWNLVGNPYPAYLKVREFLEYVVDAGPDPEVRNIDLFESGTAAAIYGYDGNAVDGWITYNLANTTLDTRIAPGQGFFVSADEINSAEYDLRFTPSMSATATIDNEDDFIAGRHAELVYLKLNASTTNKSYQTQFYFNSNASLGLDIGYDAEVWGGIAPSFALYSHLIENNTGIPVGLQALNSADLSNVVIPLGVNATQGEQLTFSINDSTLPSNIEVYLEDTVANTFTLLNATDYIVVPNVNLNGTGRFFLRTSEGSLSTSENQLETLSIYNNANDKTIVVAGELQKDTKAMLFDLQGRLVATSLLESTLTNQTIDVSHLSAGVYVIQLNNATQQKIQKVIIR